MKIVDPQTHAPVPDDSEGLLMAIGPNVMLGYLDDPKRSAEVLRDGWYDTGDMARMDDDGFMFLTGRLSRFSKIGGEMVPHMAVEDALIEALHAPHQVLFVTATEEERKGEQLVMFYTDEAGDADSLSRVIKDSELPNLWKPRRENLFRIAALPTLGSGKLDMARLRALAQEVVKSRTEASQ
jgi:acyl-[acyl-carrier-protein]-phospholipid O-acyltransferase/long-chain-fatty-acid--[acyl-carrier-protein] ligase